MSLNSVLSTARTAITAQQLAVETASHNISNAEVAGYSKQSTIVAANTPLLMPYGSVGTGVVITGIGRSRDALLDATYRNDAGTATRYASTSDAMTEIDGILGEPSDTGLSSALDAFWSSWSDLASDPTNSAGRSVVMTRGDQLARKLNDFAARLDDLKGRTLTGLTNDIATVNRLTAEVASLNPRIVAAEAGKSTANDLRDERDRALDQLAKLTGATSIERGSGAVGVYIGGELVVDADASKPLATQGFTPPTLVFQASGKPLSGVGGSIGAEIDTVANRIPSVMSQLDALAKGLVDTVNAIHSSGVVFSGTPPVAAPAGNFFDVSAAPPPTGDPLKTARGIRLAATMTSAASVAASGGGAAGPGDNSVALALAGLRDANSTFTSPDGLTTLGTMSFGNFYRNAVSSVGSAANDAKDSATVFDTVAANSDTRRQGVSAVSTDEELVSIIQHQHSYSAAAKLVTVVDEMAQTLIDLVH